ncbi:hypothetical protein Fmac_028521 [Flemingia macrophylla]|uniref:Uncharacterized protein n=1 Tax=Flemingia macrophylla TaxID=520843 RepID=A0ABD1L7R0_9FABA
MAIDISAETKKPEGKLDVLVNLGTQLAVNQKPASVARQFSARNDAIVVSGVQDVATNTSAETRKLEGKLDPLVNLVTLLAANQKTASVAIVCGFRSSNDHHTSSLSARNNAIIIKGVHDVATDTSAETRKLEDKLDTLVNLVTQLAAAFILPMSTILVSILLCSNLEWMSILRLMLQTPAADHHSSRDKTLDRKDGSQLLASFSARNDAIVIRGVHDVATYTSAETRKLEGKLDALVNLVTQLAANQKPASVARVCDIRSSNDHHTSVCPSSQQSGVDEHPEAYALFSARNDAIVIIGVHDLATDTSAETRKLEGKLNALVKLVTQLAANQKPAIVTRVYDIRSSNDHHTSVCPSSQQSGVDEHPEAYVVNTYSRPPQQQRQDT